MADKFLRLPQVKDRVGYKSDSQIYALVQAGKFPPPVKIGSRASAWIESEINAWIEQRVAESRATGQEG
jgi:prophage regulatory protein